MIPSAEITWQIAVDPLLDGRPVTTFSNGQLVTWTAGIDRDHGYVTRAAAEFLKQSGAALPDDARFPANEQHPEMLLHFANSASPSSPQARSLASTGSFDFGLPRARYSALFLALTSSYGDCPLTVTLTYADQHTSTSSFQLPDWGTGQPLPSDPPIFFDLIDGLHKWTRDNAQVDTPTHTLIGVKLSADPSSELTRVAIAKTAATPLLLFWGATAVGTPIVDEVAGNAGVGGMAASGGGSQGGGGTSGGAAGDATSAGSPAGGAPPAVAGSASAGSPPIASNQDAQCSVRRPATPAARASGALLVMLAWLGWARRLSSRR